MQKTRDLPVWAWFWLAVVPVTLLLLGRFVLFDIDTYRKLFVGEFGIIELLTAFLLIPAIILALICAKRFWQSKLRLAAGLLVIYAIGCLYISGEELSWGQHIFGWDTPDYFAENNKQGETNLHNLYGSNRGLHKFLLVIGMGIGGVIIPLWAKLKGVNYLPSKHWIIWLIPTRICLPVSVFVFVTHTTHKVMKWMGLPRHYEKYQLKIAELVELYISIFLILYIASLFIRLAQTSDLFKKDLAIGP